MYKVLLSLILILIVTPVSSSNIDLREANVVKVDYKLIEGTEYNFDVTLFHDDDG
jgi:hypothetical protein